MDVNKIIKSQSFINFIKSKSYYNISEKYHQKDIINNISNLNIYNNY